MFLRRQGYSRRFTFDVIYSTLQKSLRRGDITLSIEMGYEFNEYPNALKKRLIQNCTEDCPDLNLINDIFNAPQDLQHLISFIPVICKHVKCHDGCYGMRIACEMEPIKDPPNLSKDHHDDLLTLLRKCLFHICNNNELSFIFYFQQIYKTIDLFKIYQFIGENKTFLYMLCVWETTDFMHEKYEVLPLELERSRIFDKLMKLPHYVYDKHVKNCPKTHKSYKFFIDNLVLYPRKPESELEKEAKKLYINSEKGIAEIFDSIIDKSVKKGKKTKSDDDLEIIDFKVKLIQKEKMNQTSQTKVYFCSMNNGKRFDRILKGPFENEDEINAQLLSDIIKQKLLSLSPSYISKKVSYKNQVYILSVNMIRIEKANIIMNDSDINSIPIYNGTKYHFSHQILESFTSNEILELLKILAFRKIIGTTETCVNNIIYYNKHLYSINDPVLLQNTQFMFKNHIDKWDNYYDKIVSNNFKKISCFLNGWQTVVRNTSDIPDNVKFFIFAKISDLLIRDNWKF